MKNEMNRNKKKPPCSKTNNNNNNRCNINSYVLLCTFGILTLLFALLSLQLSLAFINTNTNNASYLNNTTNDNDKNDVVLTFLNDFRGGGGGGGKRRARPNNKYNNKKKKSRNAVMVIAAAPLDKRHVTALWSELDCFTRDKDIRKVLVSAPLWSEPIIRRIIQEAKEKLPHFGGGGGTGGGPSATIIINSTVVELDAQFFRNDRYDVGLWCDGLQSLKKKNNNNSEGEYKYNYNDDDDDVILLNDSLFALRPFTGILDALRGRYNNNGNNNYNSNSSSNNFKNNDSAQPKRMTSLSYSLTDPGGMWLESVYRAFDPRGLEVFMDHSCRHDATHEIFCPNIIDSREKKRCIINNHEIAIARLFTSNPNRSGDDEIDSMQMQSEQIIQGLFPSDVPKELWKPGQSYGTWTMHVDYWKSTLVEKMNFPAAKVSKRNMIRTMKDPLIQECTAKFNRSIFEEESDIFDFSAGVRTIDNNNNN